MKIVNVALEKIFIPLAPGLPEPTGRHYGGHMLVRVRCDNGLEGVGERYCGNATSAVAAVIEDMLAPALIGQEAADVAGLYERMFRSSFYFGRGGIVLNAISALEIALWDILGKHLGVPVYALLGGSVRQSMASFPSLQSLMRKEDKELAPAYASMQTYKTPDDVAEAAMKAVEAGFRSIKLHQIDIESVKATREAVGDEIEISIDPTGRFNPLEAENFAKKLAEYNVSWLEEPIWPPDDYCALARLKSRSPIAIAGGENEGTVWGFRRILDAQAVDILQPEVANMGGILESLKVYALAQSHNIPIAIHNFKYGPVLAASAHLALLFPNVIWLETPWFHLEADILKVAPEISNGHVKLTRKPGLGIEVDEDVIREYRVEVFPRL